MSESIIIQIIQSIGLVLSAVLPIIVFAVWKKRRDALDKLSVAQQDILFLLEAEKRYGQIIAFHESSTMKNTVRAQVRNETALNWSGENTHSKITDSALTINNRACMALPDVEV